MSTSLFVASVAVNTVGSPQPMSYALLILLFLTSGTVVPVLLHQYEHGVFNVNQVALAFFLWLNVMINFWEICLFLRVRWIRTHFETLRDSSTESALTKVLAFFSERVPLNKIFSTFTWSKIWSTYSLFDESYSDSRSYGFWIDVGNGFSTLLPSLLVLYGMTFEIVPARVLGIVTVVLFWQMFYGTVVYFAQFLYHRRYRNHRLKELVLFVGMTNGMWFVLPLWGIYLGVEMINGNSFDMFR